MTVITYTVPLVLSAEDNKTYANKYSILIKDCSDFGDPTSECDGWNFNFCPNDDKYCQPFISGDLIYSQFKFNNKKYAYSSVEFINTETGEDFYSSAAVTSQVGIDSINNKYINAIIDTSNAIFIGVNCFYIKYTLTELVGGAKVYFTVEPYCLVKCDIQTLLIEGSYPSGYDCFGGYYGDLNVGGSRDTNIYKPIFRVYGVVESDGFDFEETVMNNRRIKSKQSERFWLMTKKIPYYVVKQLAVCFNSQLVTIDGVEYTGTIKLNKNFDEGSMWIIKENIYRVCDEITFTCK